MLYDQNNIFAKILRDEIPCKKINENKYYLAFHDIQPKAPIHVLVIPKGYYANAQNFHLNASSEEIAGFYKGLADVVESLNIKEGFRLISNCGLNGGQEVPHYHMHILGGRKLGSMLTDNS
jgi:histidine triad (HIT) family protein